MTPTVWITGISGFIAGRLARSLTGTGVPVVGVGRTPPREKLENLTFAPLDIRDFKAVRALMARERPQIIYHLAADSVLQGAEHGPRGLLETNVAGTANVLEAAREAQIPAVVVASSDKQYGALAVPPYDDADSTAFMNGGAYELSKAQQDQTARLYAGLYDVPAVRVARLANIYGPGDTQWTRIVPNTIRRTVRDEAPVVRAGAGAALREYVFVDDAVHALRTLADDALTRGNTPLRRPQGRLASVAFNIGSGQNFAAASVIETIQRVLREEFGVAGRAPEVVPADPGIFEPGSQFNDLTKLRTLVPDYAPRSLEQGLRETIPWYLEHLRK